MIDSPFLRTQNGVFSIQEERIDRSSGECRVIKGMQMLSENVSDMLLEVSKNKPAEQSSHCKYSIGPTSADDAGRAVSEFLCDDYAFHTGQDQNPWWRVDLLQSFLIKRVEITNRAINEFLFKNFRIESSDDGISWKLQFLKADNKLVSSDPECPEIFEIPQPFLARFVRIVQIGFNSMHLRRVRIFGVPCGSEGTVTLEEGQGGRAEAHQFGIEKNTFVAGANVSVLGREAFSLLLNKAVLLENSIFVKMNKSGLRDTSYTALEHGGKLLIRSEISIRYLENLFKNYGDWSMLPPDKELFSFIFQGDDRPVDQPSVSWQTKTYYKNVCLVPDFYYTNNFGYSSFLPDGVKSWDLREPKAFWRGATTGGFGISTESLSSLPRFRLCEIGFTLRDKADFGIYQVVQAKSEETKQEIESVLRSRGMLKNRINLEEFSNYKFFVQIDGNGNSWDLIQKLRLGCCMLLVESDWVLWHYDRIVPWEHYVPVKKDLSDIGDILEWCLAHDDLARDIGSNGRKFALGLDYEAEMRSAAAGVFRHFVATS